MDERIDESELRDSRLDALLRSALVVEPPPEVQRTILAAVLQAAELPAAMPVAARQVAEGRPPAPAAAVSTISPLAYLLLGAVLLAYVGLVSWLQGALGDAGWLSTLARQLAVAADLLIGQPLAREPGAIVILVLQAAPWLLLLPLAWLLWERDRASASAG